MTLEAIFEQCEALSCSLVEITGGEPLAQANCSLLAEGLLDRSHGVLVETSGSLPINVLPERCIKIMDLKCPGSGEVEKNDWSNIEALSPRDEVKFVLASRFDYEWSRGVVREYGLSERCNAVLFSPVFGAIEPESIVKWILDDGLDVRFQLQMHKYIWRPNERGV